MIAYNLQSRPMPFILDKLNKLEELSILTAATTIFCGLLYLTDDIGEGVKILLFVFIVISKALS